MHTRLAVGGWDHHLAGRTGDFGGEAHRPRRYLITLRIGKGVDQLGVPTSEVSREAKVLGWKWVETAARRISPSLKQTTTTARGASYET